MDILSKKAVMRELLAEYSEKKARAEREADAVRQRISRKVPVYANLSGTITGIFMEATRLAAQEPERAQIIIASAQQRLQSLRTQAEAELRANGFAPDMLAPRYECALCKDTGFVGEPVHEHCNCLRTALNKRLYDRAGIAQENFAAFDPSVFSQEIPEGGQESQRAVMEKYRVYCEKFADSYPAVNKREMLLTGASGLGKTYLLNCIYARLLDRGIPALRLTAFRMLEIMRKVHRGQDEGEFTQLMHTDVLILDDLGSEPMLENVTVEYLFNLLNERKQARLSTLVATNLSLRELQARYTERTLSRLAAQNETQILRFVGRDVRMNKKS